MSNRFQACLAETLKWEGGWSNDPHDPGGPTMQGVIQRVYDAWRDQRRLPRQSVRKISRTELEDIYLRNYWRMARCDELPAPLDLAVFDFGVNSGPTRAIKHLQKVLGVNIDGQIGPVTIAAARAADPVETALALTESRRGFLRQIKTFWRFGRGWLRRCDGIDAACSAPAHQQQATFQIHDYVPPPMPQQAPAVAPLDDPYAQSASQGRATEPEKTSLAVSTTARAAEAGGGLSTVQLGVEVAGATNKAKGASGIDPVGFVLALAQSPTFWIALGLLGSATYVWLERRRKVRML